MREWVSDNFMANFACQSNVQASTSGANIALSHGMYDSCGISKLNSVSTLR